MLGRRASNAAADAIRALIGSIEISDSNGVVLAAVPYPELKAIAQASGDAAKWRVEDAAGAFLASGKVGEGLTLERTDIQYGGVVTIDRVEIEIQ